MKKKQILIVEDEPIVADDIKMTLHKLGYAVPAIASSGKEAIKKTEEIHPDLVLMDIVLKGKMDGIEATRIIRSRFDIPVIYLTAFADKKILERAKITEPYGYIIKPFEDRELKSTIEIALYKHKMERKLKESEEWLFTTLKSIGDAVIATDKKGYVTFMNPVAQILTGWKQEETAGRPLKDVFQIINEETGEPAEDPLPEVLREGRVIGVAERTVLVAKDGRRIPIADTCAPIKYRKGNIAGAVLVFQDITERTKLQKDLMQAEKMAAIGTMAASVAHELRNPLGVIKTAVYNLRQNLQMKDVKTERRIANINKKVEEADKIINDLLNYSRLRKPNLVNTNINELIEEAESRVKSEFSGNKITTIKKLGKISEIKVDRVQMSGVFQNIIRNAYEAMDSGDKLTLCTKYIKSKKSIEISIADTGCGISRENLEKLDKPFFSTKAKGTGLGLPLAFRIVKENHRGIIEVKSDVGKGTEFKVILPAEIV